MSRAILGCLAALMLAACGADGAPTRPESKQQSGLTVSGEARIGVTGTL